MNTLHERVDWVDYAKGICIIAVVTLYAAAEAKNTLGSSGWMQYWADFAKPFRMPDFFLISGLFLARTINKPWRHYLDRKVVHFLYFYTVWSIIYMIYRIGAGEFVGESFIFVSKSFVSMFLFWPFHQMWFILMLPIFFICTRLLKGVPVWLVFPVLCLIHVFPPIEVQMSMMPGDFFARYVFFYAGYAFAPYFFRFARKVQDYTLIALLLLTCWGVVNSLFVFNGYLQYKIITLGLGFCGVFAVIAVAALLQKLDFMGWLQYLGANSIIVYLPFFLPMKVASVAINKVYPLASPGLFSVAVTVLSILASVLFYRLAQKTAGGVWLLSRPAWVKVSP